MTLQRVQGSMWVGYSWTWQCVDTNSGQTAAAKEKEVSTCDPGFRQERGTMQGELSEGNLCVPESTPQSTDAKAVYTGPTSCSATWDKMTNPGTCLFRAAMAGLGSVLITLTAWLLKVVGLLFNYLLWYTVIAFGDSTNGFLTKDILTGINTTWTVFRDIANILIIGLFTFIAISTILGNHEFGAKKMLAKALIIAVLINFSLLFTKMIIDVSNFTAYQFYAAAGGTIGVTKPADSGGTLSFKQDGIGGTFIKFLGVTSISDTFDKLKSGADAQDSGWITLLHGLFGATMLLATALVFLYGSFLLVSRAILIVFLLITSSLAFAAYLLPKSIQGSYGWSTWWNSLVKTAVFAPLLMMFLWATINLATKLNPGGKGTLGALMTDPTNGGNLSALFGYIIILGLLFASFQISSSFSSKIAGFNLAALIPAIGLGAVAGIGGFLGRQAIGRPAMAIGERLQNRSGATSNAFAKRMYDLGAQGFKSVSKRDFNAMRTGLGTAVAGTAGKKVDELVGKAVGGFEGSQKAFLKRTAEMARRTKPDDETKEKGQQDARDKVTRTDIDQAYKAAMAENEHRDRAAEHEDVKEALQQYKETSEQAINEMRKGVSEAFERTQRSPGDQAAQADLQRMKQRVQTAEAEQERQITEQSEHIRGAQKLVAKAARKIEGVDKDLNEVAKDAGYNRWAFQTAGDRAKDLAGGFSALLYASGVSKKSREKLAAKAAKEAGKQERQQNFKEKYGDALKEMMKEDEHAKETPRAAAPAARAEPARSDHPAEPSGGGDHGERH